MTQEYNCYADTLLKKKKKTKLWHIGRKHCAFNQRMISIQNIMTIFTKSVRKHKTQ